jgi:hypothetical protein
LQTLKGITEGTMKNLIFRLFVTVGILVVAAVLILRATPLDGRLDGFGVNLPTRPQPSLYPAALDELSKLNVRWVRVEFPWDEIEPSPNAYQWTFTTDSTFRDLDALVSQAQQRSLNMVAVLDGGPVYLSHQMPNSPVNSDDLLTRWRLYVQAVVQRYGSQIHVWQIGNDVNTYQGWGSVVFPTASDASATPDPTLYAKLLQAAYEIIKAANPGDTVVLSGLSFTGNGDCITSPYAYLGQLDAAGAWDNFDVAAMNLWWGSGSPEQITNRGSAFNPQTGACLQGQSMQTDLINEVRSFKQLILQFGDKPLWVTATGWQQSDLQAQATQAGIDVGVAEANDVIRTLVPILSEPGVQKVFWQSLPDIPQNPGYPTTAAGQQALSNLGSLLTGSQPLGQRQGQQAGSAVYEYRFQKDGRLISFIWRSTGGVAAQPVIVTSLNDESVTTYPASAAGLSGSTGTSQSPASDGTLALNVNEDPIVLVAQSPDLIQRGEAAVEDRIAAWRDGLTAMGNHWLDELRISATNAVSAWLRNLGQQIVESVVNQFSQWFNKALGQIGTSK